LVAMRAVQGCRLLLRPLIKEVSLVHNCRRKSLAGKLPALTTSAIMSQALR
jgi:hypothetical protein